MIDFSFNPVKATQMAAVLIRSEQRPLKYIKLMKLMYLADRMSLAMYGRPISGDRVVAMRHGPVLSNVYNFISDDPVVAETFWSRHIRQPEPYFVDVYGDPGVGALSEAELDILQQVADEFKPLNEWQTVEWCHHNLPEWQNPGDTSRPISYEAILETGLGMSADRMTQIEEAAAEEVQFEGEVNLEELLGPIVLGQDGSPRFSINPTHSATAQTGTAG